MESYRFNDQFGNFVLRIDTGQIFSAFDTENSLYQQWQTWLQLGNTTLPYEPPVLSEPVQWAVDNLTRAKVAHRVLWRLWKSSSPESIGGQNKNAQNTLLDAFGVLNDPNNSAKVFVLNSIIGRKNTEGLGNTLTETDITNMSNADRRTMIRIFKEECSIFLTSALAGPTLAED